MNITRKEFLRAGALITGGLLTEGFRFFKSAPDEYPGLKVIRDNIGIYIGQGGTIAWYVDKNNVASIDSQFPDSAKKFIEGLKTKTTRKIDLHFNTHHHGDHTSGNVVIKEYTNKIIAHENCRKLQESSFGNDPNKPQVYADATFKNTWEEPLGSERISAQYFGPAHTGGDAVIHFQEANIAHVGDLVFNKTFPYIDNKGGGSIKEWIETLEKISKFYDNDTQFICGHAASDDLVILRKKDLDDMKNYFEALIIFVMAEIRKGKSREEIGLLSEIPGFVNLKERWEGARKLNLERAYDEITGSDK
ncbi:MAG: MBL fold metallo-hydrolase [Bacteroidota bacterium]